MIIEDNYSEVIPDEESFGSIAGKYKYDVSSWRRVHD